jgi:hypothetical protein
MDVWTAGRITDVWTYYMQYDLVNDITMSCVPNIPMIMIHELYMVGNSDVGETVTLLIK